VVIMVIMDATNAAIAGINGAVGLMSFSPN
jgi:hypothetical protein